MEPEHRQGSEESLTSATESDLMAKVDKLSSVLLGTNSNVTVLNQRLTEYQRTHEVALEEIRRSVAGSTQATGALDNVSPLHRSRGGDVEKESTPRPGHAHSSGTTGGGRCCAKSSMCNTDNANSPINALVSLLGEKDTSLTSLRDEMASLRRDLDRARADLQRVNDERLRDKETADNFRRTVHTQLKHNIGMVNRLVEHSSSLPTSVKRALLGHSPQEDFVVQQAELSSKLEWLAKHVHTEANKGSQGPPQRR